eukprot:CAMPEP_0198294712 /NCGR_PEP_ID=MMETSP1449-20131203/23875_1 /TAXON_ID=420275 /ORGANISM="Attheya septentrionalis, Strain CCMP2084" /LENGTH=122 /DNA_ID=CAMNT_0043994751 /DNA_START=327 /DNA_END=695 /DNA_ORIENTATION=+
MGRQKRRQKSDERQCSTEKHDNKAQQEVTAAPQPPARPTPVANVGISRHSLNANVLQQARHSIQLAQADRQNSKLPPLLIPLVEICLPNDYRLSQLERDADHTFQQVFGSCFNCGSGGQSCK